MDTPLKMKQINEKKLDLFIKIALILQKKQTLKINSSARPTKIEVNKKL